MSCPRLRWSVNLLKRKVVSRLLSFTTIFSRQWMLLTLSVRSLFGNDDMDSGYIADTLMEPLFWFVDNFTASLGPAFVGLVVVSLTVYVGISYVIGLTFWLEKSYVVTAIALVLGNWILVNVAFNYFMALITGPGHPPEKVLIKEVASICKKCISPKPPRAHHCSVCNKCVLKMDHHCREYLLKHRTTTY